MPRGTLCVSARTWAAGVTRQALGGVTPDVMYFQAASKNPAALAHGRAPKKAA
jgi:hypothetical protein